MALAGCASVPGGATRTGTYSIRLGAPRDRIVEAARAIASANHWRRIHAAVDGARITGVLDQSEDMRVRARLRMVEDRLEIAIDTELRSGDGRWERCVERCADYTFYRERRLGAALRRMLGTPRSPVDMLVPPGYWQVARATASR